MQPDFDPYHRWLGITPAEQPPDHYRLLGIVRFEQDLDVISNAADARMGFVRTFQSGRHSEASQRLLNEISAARICLLDPKLRRAYDLALRAKTAPGVTPGDRKPTRPAAALPRAVPLGETQKSAPRPASPGDYQYAQLPNLAPSPPPVQAVRQPSAAPPPVLSNLPRSAAPRVPPAGAPALPAWLADPQKFPLVLLGGLALLGAGLIFTAAIVRNWLAQPTVAQAPIVAPPAAVPPPPVVVPPQPPANATVAPGPLPTVPAPPQTTAPPTPPNTVSPTAPTPVVSFAPPSTPTTAVASPALSRAEAMKLLKDAGASLNGTDTEVDGLNFYGNFTDDMAVALPAFAGEVRSINFQNCDITGKTIAALAGYEKLHAFDLYMAPRLKSEDLRPLADCKKLSLVQISASSVDESILDVLRDCRELRIVSIFPPPKDLLVYLQKLAQFPQITQVPSESPQFGDAELAFTAQNFKLTQFSFQSASISSQGMSAFRGMRSLQQLRIPSHLKDEDFLHFVDLPELKHLQSFQCQAGDGAMVHIAKIRSLEQLDLPLNATSKGIALLAQLAQLRHLNLGNRKLMADDFQALRALEWLETLDGVSVADKQLELLAGVRRVNRLSLSPAQGADLSSLKNISFLENLTVHKDFFSTDDISAISAARGVRSLYLMMKGGAADATRKLTDDEALLFSKIGRLHNLSAMQFSISPEALQKLRLALPNCSFDFKQ